MSEQNDAMLQALHGKRTAGASTRGASRNGYSGSSGAKPEPIRPHFTEEATVEAIGEDSYEVHVPTDLGEVVVTCNQVQLNRHTFETVLSVGISGSFGRRFPYSERINLLSGSARESLRRALENFYTKDLQWAEVLNTSYILTRRAFLESDPSERADVIPEPEDLQHLIKPLLLEGVPTVLFGHGDSGKTFVALGIAAAFVLCDNMGGISPERFGPALYLDYETNRQTFRYRWGRILAGLGHPSVPEAPMFYWPGRGISLPDQADAIERKVRKEGIELIIVDSAAPACGGKPEDAEVTQRYFAALAHIGVTTLTLAHINRSDDTRSPFGSIFWRNQPRRIWYCRRADKAEPTVLELGLYCRKNNDGPTPRPLGFTVGFSDRSEGGDGAIRFDEIGVGSVPDLADELPLRERIWEALATPMLTTELASVLKVSADSVRRTLNRHRGSHFAQAGQGERWARAARQDQVS